MKFFEGTSHRWTATLINLAAIVVIIAGLRAAAPVITQFLLIAFLVIILSPLYYWMVKKRVPSWLALALLVLVLTVGIFASIILLAQSIAQLAQHLPDYQQAALKSIDMLRGWAKEQFDMELPDVLFGDVVSRQNVGMVVGFLLQATQGFLGRGFIIILITAFCLYELPRLPALRKNSWMTETVWAKLIYVTEDVRHYMNIKTVVSIGTGIGIYIGLRLFSIDSPLLLGLMAFLLNYIPVVGSMVAAVPAVLLALVKFGPERAIAVLVLYCVVNLVFGGILEPKLMGKGFRISPVVVLLSLLFWGFVLGPVGMMLSVPLTMGLRIVFVSLQELAKQGEEN